MEVITVYGVDELPEEVMAKVMNRERGRTEYTEHCEQVAYLDFVEHCEEHGITFVNKDEVSRWNYSSFVTDDEEINEDPYEFVEFKFFQPAHQSDENLIEYLNERYLFTMEGDRIPNRG